MVGPIAVTTALPLHLDPIPVGVAVSIACSSTFLTPVAHPANVLMMDPGGYTFKGFWCVGWGPTLVCFAVMLVALTLLWKMT